MVYIISLVVGLLLAYLFKGLKAYEKTLDKAITAALYVLLVFMGIKIGSDDGIFGSLGTIGVKSLLIAVAALAGSIIFTKLLEKIIGGKK